jgi:hypothetical protein
MSENGRNPEREYGASEEQMRASESDSDLTAFEGRVRDAYVRSPAPAVAQAHLTAMLAEAQAIAATASLETETMPSKRTPRNRWVLARRLALAPLAVLVAGAGLAVAGVRPPEPISDLFERVGVDVPGSDHEGADADKGDKAPAGRDERGDGSDGAGIGAADGGNPTNDGPTPGARHANEKADGGQETAEQARSGDAPPDAPGRSDDHPAPQGNGTPPEDPGHEGHGKPDSPPGQSRSSGQEPGGGTANQPDKPNKPDDETEQ